MAKRGEACSPTPLAKKLGIRAGSRVGLLAAPARFAESLAPLPADVTIVYRLGGRFDVVVSFHRRAAELVRRMPALTAALEKHGGLWVAWPKKSSAVATDLAFDRVQACGLEAGLVDNKVCAIDATWSGLRFVYRRRDR